MAIKTDAGCMLLAGLKWKASGLYGMVLVSQTNAPETSDVMANMC